ncbi:MAG: PASTA domain-containing protein [Prolixibacteraceae bacterium]|nr:PASTA domain-containing protein [Prolixibacteraceae bacterium]
MSLQKFFTSRAFIINLLLAVVLAFIIILGIMQWLKVYTHHGEAHAVPDFSGLMGEEIAILAKQNNLKFEIVDSIYDNEALPGVVVEQQPEAGFGVKQNRKIFLTINSLQREMVQLPKLTDISFRQAQVLAENTGIIIGNIYYAPSEYDDLVLRILKDSIPLNAGEMVLKGSSIDLVLGRNQGNEDTHLPDLTGVNITDAKIVLTNSMLNTGVLIYDETCVNADDSLNAFVWRQYPSVTNTKKIRLGSSVDLWLTTDSLKITPPEMQGEME